MSERAHVPPADIDAEKAVISAALLSSDALAEVVGVLRPEHFYADRHGTIWRAIVELNQDNAEADTITVSGKLRDTGMLDQVGGTPYLGEIVDTVPAVAHIDQYAKTIQEKWRLRTLIATCQKFAAEGYQAESAELVLAELNHELDSVAEAKSLKTQITLKEAVRKEVDAYNLRSQQKGYVPGLPSGIHDLDVKIGGLKRGNMYVLAGRPGLGKTGKAITAAIKVASVGFGVPYISMEMPHDQLTQRVVAQIGSLDVKELEEGRLSAEDMSTYSSAAVQAAQLPIAIDDEAEQTPNSLRSAVRRAVRKLKSEYGCEKIGLIVVDYLQLMEGDGKSKTREEDVAKMSKACRKLAKEFRVPVLALSQLNRSVESRADKRPMLADLRECLPNDEWVYTPTGPVQMRDRPTQVISATAGGIEARAARFVPKHQNKVLRIKTAFGSFRVTPKHLVLTGTGWKQARHLVPGRDVIAAPKSIPHENRGQRKHARLLGWLLGNGGLAGTPSLIFRTELEVDVRRAVEQFGVEVRPRAQQKSANVIDAYLSNGTESGSRPNPLMLWLRRLGLEGKTAHSKSVPAEYLGSSDDTHRELLKGLWESDGTVTGGTAKYTSVSELLARQVAWLLLTLGIRSTVNQYDSLWEVRVAHEDNDRMGPIVATPGRFGPLAVPDPHRIDPAPQIFVELADEMSHAGRRLQKRADGGHKLICKKDIMALVRENPCLSTIAKSPYGSAPGLGWARLLEVERADSQVRVSDLQVPGPNNFVASGLVVHNSGAIEQDAFGVFFIYREDYYRKRGEQPDGRAELIVGKLRQGGTTGTVECGFHGPSSAFYDLQSHIPERDFTDFG